MKLKSKIKNYSVQVVDSVFANKAGLLSQLKFKRAFYLVDQKLMEHYFSQMQLFIGDNFCLTIPAKEENKEYFKLGDYYGALVEAGIQRSDVLITFGGGVLQDISGFIASTLYRGIKWIFIPTTLLAQADSCIGSKTSINFGDFKNLIGSFYPPDLICIDPTFTTSLSLSDFNSGIGEIIKFHILSDNQRYAKLREFVLSPDLRQAEQLQKMIQSTLEIKRSYFESDEFDTGRRNLLNYGHCFGHALESASNFGISHGEAVLVGMGFANLLALRRGILNVYMHGEFEDLFKRRYPKFDFSKITADNIIHYLKKDKKREGRDLTMIMGSDVGCFDKYTDVKEQEIHDVYAEFIDQYSMQKGEIQ